MNLFVVVFVQLPLLECPSEWRQCSPWPPSCLPPTQRCPRSPTSSPSMSTSAPASSWCSRRCSVSTLQHRLYCSQFWLTCNIMPSHQQSHCLFELFNFKWFWKWTIWISRSMQLKYCGTAVCHQCEVENIQSWDRLASQAGTQMYLHFLEFVHSFFSVKNIKMFSCSVRYLFDYKFLIKNREINSLFGLIWIKIFTVIIKRINLYL